MNINAPYLLPGYTEQAFSFVRSEIYKLADSIEPQKISPQEGAEINIGKHIAGFAAALISKSTEYVEWPLKAIESFALLIINAVGSIFTEQCHNNITYCWNKVAQIFMEPFFLILGAYGSVNGLSWLTQAHLSKVLIPGIALVVGCHIVGSAIFDHDLKAGIKNHTNEFYKIKALHSMQLADLMALEESANTQSQMKQMNHLHESTEKYKTVEATTNKANAEEKAELDKESIALKKERFNPYFWATINWEQVCNLGEEELKELVLKARSFLAQQEQAQKELGELIRKEEQNMRDILLEKHSLPAEIVSEEEILPNQINPMGNPLGIIDSINMGQYQVLHPRSMLPEPDVKVNAGTVGSFYDIEFSKRGQNKDKKNENL